MEAAQKYWRVNAPEASLRWLSLRIDLRMTTDKSSGILEGGNCNVPLHWRIVRRIAFRSNMSDVVRTRERGC
jgi:hypothetical protein